MALKRKEKSSFSLLDFINQKQDVTEQNAPLIVAELLKPYNFKYKEIKNVSQWFHELPAYQRELLLDNDELYEALDVDNGANYVFVNNDLNEKLSKDSKKINELIQMKMPAGIAKWVVLNFRFPRLKLPSNAYLYVDENEFFDLLKKNVKDFPHIIDELKLLKFHLKEGVNIVPDNGYFLRFRAVGVSISKTKSIQIYRDVFNGSSLETILHELGHLEREGIYQRFNRFFFPLIQYIDEAEQFAKSFFIDAFMREEYPTLPFINQIKKQVKEEYPKFSPITVERLTAFRAKNLFAAFILMDTKSRNSALLHFVKKKYITPKQSQKLMQEFYDIYDYYPKRYPFLNSAHYQKALVREVFFKRFRMPKLLKEVFEDKTEKEIILSDAYLDELNQKSAFVDTQREDVSLLSTDKLFLGETKVSLCLRDVPLKRREKILNFYENYDVFFKESEVTPLIYQVDQDEMVDNVKRLVLTDFYRAPVKNQKTYVKVDYKDVGDVPFLKSYLDEMKKDASLKMKNEPAYFETKTGVFVSEKLLEKTPFSYLNIPSKRYQGCILDYVETQRYEDEVFERFSARKLPLKAIINDENKKVKSLCLFQKNVSLEAVNSYFSLQKEAAKVQQFVSSYIGVENENFIQNKEEAFCAVRTRVKKQRFDR